MNAIDYICLYIFCQMHQNINTDIIELTYQAHFKYFEPAKSHPLMILFLFYDFYTN